MHGKLPDQIDPRRLAQHAAVLVGEIPKDTLERLGSAFEVRDNARVELRFGWSEHSRVRITGRLSVPVASICQRCLQTYATTLEAEIDLEIGEAGRDAEQDFELVLKPGERLSLLEFLEDELLLAAPMIALHPRETCSTPAAAGTASEREASATRRPFAELQKLRDRGPR